MTRRSSVVLSWIMQAIAAGILAQTAVFKLLGVEESRLLFETLGAEPTGRIGLGVVEILVALLLLVPRTAALGGLAALALMLGAIFSHLTKLGIVFNDDGGALFVMGLVTLLASAGVVLLRRDRLPLVGTRLAHRPPVA